VIKIRDAVQRESITSTSTTKNNDQKC